MKHFILFFALITCSLGFSSNNVNKIKKQSDLTITELLISNLDLKEVSTNSLKHEISDIKYDDEFAPCSLTVTVTTKVVVKGRVEAQTTVTGTLRLDDCKDIGAIGGAFIKGLIDEAIASVQKQLNK